MRNSGAFHTAGILDAPPAMVDAISDWAQSLLAGLMIPQLEKRFKGIYVPKEMELTQIEKLLADFEVNGTEDLVRAIIAVLPTRELQEIWRGWYYKPWSRIIQKRMAERARQEIRGIAEKEAKVRERGLADRSVLQGWIREVEGLNPKKGSTQPEGSVHLESKFFPFSMQGWRYRSLFEKAGKTPRGIWVYLDSRLGKQNASGTWDPINWELRLAIKSFEITEGFTNPSVQWVVSGVRETIRHELQHAAQTALKDLVQSKSVGLPGKAIQTPQQKGHSLQEDTTWQELAEGHALQDVEFYTRLADAVAELKRAGRTDPEYLKAFLNGEVPRGSPGYQGSFFLGVWKKRAPGKWRKAVGEVVQAMGGRDSLAEKGLAKRIAAQYLRDLK